MSKPLNVHPSSATSPAPHEAVTNPNDISSPHELAAFVENLLQRLDSQFDDMSAQVLDKMNQMSSRVDALENAIQDIINGENQNGPQSPK